MDAAASKIEEPSLRLFRSPARDARGRDVWPLLRRSLREMKWDRRRREDYKRLVFGSPRRMWLIVGTWIGLLTLPMILASVWLFPQFMAAIGGIGRSPIPLKFLIIFQLGVYAAVLLVAFTLNWWYLRRNASRRIMPCLLADGLCAACTYAMGEAAPDIDGNTVCSECGSAWCVEAAAPSSPA